MKIALVAFHFKPDEAIGSVRAENWAAWLSERHEVVVITREAIQPNDSQEHRYTIRRPGSVLIRSIDRLNTWRKKLRMKTAVRPTKLNRVSIAKPRVPSGAFVYRMPCLHDTWLLASYRALLAEQPDLVIASHSPYISLIAAWMYSRRNPATRLWLDFRDLWSEGYLASGLPVIRGFERWIENKALHRADLVTSVSQGCLDSFKGRVPDEKRALVYNAPSEMVKSPRQATLVGTKLTICYTGSIYSGWRDPSPLLRKFATLRDERGLSHEMVQLNVASRMPGDLLSLVVRFGVQEFVEFSGSVSRARALEMQQEADVLLLLESPAKEARGTVPAKVFEYLSSEKPILLIGPNPDSELYQLLEGHERLITLDTLVAVLLGNRALPKQTAVDFTTVARSQLIDAVRQIESK